MKRPPEAKAMRCVFLIVWKHLARCSWISRCSGWCAFRLGAGCSVGAWRGGGRGAGVEKAGMLTFAEGYMQTEETGKGAGGNVRLYFTSAF